MRATHDELIAQAARARARLTHIRAVECANRGLLTRDQVRALLRVATTCSRDVWAGKKAEALKGLGPSSGAA